MLVKIGEEIFDSDKQPIAIRVMSNERENLSDLLRSGHDTICFFNRSLPKGTGLEFQRPLTEHRKATSPAVPQELPAPPPLPTRDAPVTGLPEAFSKHLPKALDGDLPKGT